MDFLKALQVPICEVRLAGELIVVERCPLLRHYELRIIANQLVASDPVQRLEAIFDYIQVATTGIPDLSKVGVGELAPTLDSLVKLNDITELLPWQTAVRKSQKIGASSADYTNREIAIIVHTLATAYGWPEDEIANLQPETAACYVQEVLLDNWRDREFKYSLSEVAYDKNGKYQSFPNMQWHSETRGPTVEQAKAMIPKRFVPSGNIIDLTKKANGDVQEEN